MKTIKNMKKTKEKSPNIGSWKDRADETKKDKIKQDKEKTK